MRRRAAILSALGLLLAGTLAYALVPENPPNPPPAPDPFEALRAQLRTFNTLRFWGTLRTPTSRADPRQYRDCSVNSYAASCNLGGVFTMVGDGRVIWERTGGAPVNRMLFEPPSIYRYYTDWDIGPAPDSPVEFIPYFQQAFAFLRSGLGNQPATTGTNADFGIDPKIVEADLWYRLVLHDTPAGEVELFVDFLPTGELGDVAARMAGQLYVFTSLSSWSTSPSNPDTSTTTSSTWSRRSSRRPTSPSRPILMRTACSRRRGMGSATFWSDDDFHPPARDISASTVTVCQFRAVAGPPRRRSSQSRVYLVFAKPAGVRR